MIPFWQILVATAMVRTDSFVEVMEFFQPQLEPFAGQVQFLVFRDNGDFPIGTKRTRLIQAARAPYINFLDDDDRYPEDYVPLIMEALTNVPDYVGFRLQLYNDGTPAKPTIHSLAYKEWCEDDEGYYRNVSHLNPMMRAAAISGLPFPSKYPEDHEWAKQVHASGLLQEEIFIDKIMYHYYFSDKGSLNSKKWSDPARRGEITPNPEFPYVRYL